MDNLRGSAGEGEAAAREFERLKAQILVMREAMERLPVAWEAALPPDTTPTLAAIVKELAQVKGVLKRIEEHPAISFTPQQHARQIELSGRTRCAARRPDSIPQLGKRPSGAKSWR